MSFVFGIVKDWLVGFGNILQRVSSLVLGGSQKVLSGFSYETDSGSSRSGRFFPWLFSLNHKRIGMIYFLVGV